MDPTRFDLLTRRWARPLGRRTFLPGLLAGLFLSQTPLLTIARKRNQKQEKRREKDEPRTLSNDRKKKGNKDKKKKCKKGTIRCGNACVNPRSDSRNCGSCGQRCAQGTACVNGACVGTTSCPTGQILCEDLCVDPASNEDHCGRCGNVCRIELTCIDGGCGCATEGETACPGNFCFDLETDNDNCGECGNACPQGQHCQNGSCTSLSCDEGERLCQGGTCIPDGDDAFCCNQADCGGSGSDLQCVDHVCVCKTAGTGRCQAPNRSRCSMCCGGVGVGERCGPADADWVNVCISETTSICTCPPDKKRCLFNERRCSLDPMTDSTRCGDSCYDCSQQNPGSSCCHGFCNRGCDPGTSCGDGPNNIPCPANGCQPCGPGKMCCNSGPGSPAQCVSHLGSFCP